MILRLSLIEMIRSWKFCVGFILSLCLGLSSFIIIESYRDALNVAVTNNSKNILAADIEVSARRKISGAELKNVRKVISDHAEDFLVAEMPYYEFMAITFTETGSRLVTVKAISDSFPYYGTLELEDGTKILENTKIDLKDSKVWVSKDIQNQMGLKVGDELQLGQSTFTISGIMANDSTQGFRSFTIAPPIYIYIGLLDKTGLIQPGSTFTESYLYKFPEQLAKNDYLTQVQNELYKVLPDPGIRVKTPLTASESAGRQLNNLFDFLSLVAIVALFLSCLGATYLFRLYLSRKYQQIAVYRTLGIQSGGVFWIYTIQIILLSVLTLIPAIVLAQLFIPGFRALLSTLTPFELATSISAETLWVCMSIAVLASFLSSLPKLVSIQSLKPMKLFSEESSFTDPRVNLFWYVPLLLFYVALAVYQSNSWNLGFAFVAIMGGVMLLLLLVGYFLLRVIEALKVIRKWEFKYSYLGLARKKSASMAVFVSIGLGALLINLLPQLKTSLQKEFEVSDKFPSLFMFDIQGEQMEAVKKFFEEQSIELNLISPMIRSRILKINNTPYERTVEGRTFKTREEEQEVRSRNRGINLSYRSKLSDSEKIIKGKFFTTPHHQMGTDPFEISLEQRYAKRLGLTLGDQITFDIQGVELTGKVTSIRAVKWISFQPNFFILVQPEVLEDAPKTFVAATSTLDQDTKSQIQVKMSREFPNVTSLDVSKVVESGLRVSDQMSWSLELMSLLALLAGYIVLFSIVKTHLEMRSYEINLLKIFGSPFSSISLYILNEYVTLTFLAASLGAFFSVLVSYGISYYLFEGVFTLDVQALLQSITVITAISFVVCFITSIKIARTNPAKILHQ